MKDTGGHRSHVLGSSSLCSLSWPRALFEKQRRFSSAGISHLRPGLHTGCKETGALSLRRARVNHQQSCSHCLPYGMKEPEFNPWPFWGQLHPAHLEDGTPAGRSPLGKKELLQDLPQVEQENRKDPLSPSPAVMGCCSWWEEDAPGRRWEAQLPARQGTAL